MRVEVPVSSSTSKVYLQGLRDYPDPACRPQLNPEGSLAILELSLKDVYQCATTRVTNKLTVRNLSYSETFLVANILFKLALLRTSVAGCVLLQKARIFYKKRECVSDFLLQWYATTTKTLPGIKVRKRNRFWEIKTQLICGVQFQCSFGRFYTCH